MLRLATMQDLTRIMAIVQATVMEMHAYGNYQWDEVYPTEQDFASDILLFPWRKRRQNAPGDAADGLRLRFAPPRSIGPLSPDPITGDAYLLDFPALPARKI